MVLPDGSRGNVVELRVHGVSGTPPEELLDRQLVRQVAGDKTAGFYRPRLREEWRDRPSNDPGTDSAPYSTGQEDNPPPFLEGYSWGGLTSGSPSRALWLILLPFTLINVAPRMRPVPGDTPDAAPRSAWWVWFLGRVMAVSLTVTITLGATGIGLAILTWQCVTTCTNLPWPLSAMFFGTSAGWRVLWGASAPLIMLALLALLSWRNSVQYDLIRPMGLTAPVNDPAELGSPTEPRLADPGFWYGRFPVSRLRHLHLQAGVASVGVSLLIASTSQVWRGVGLGLGALIGVLLLAGLAWPGLLRRTDLPGEATGTPTRMTRYRNTGWILLIWLPVAVILLLGLAIPTAANGEMPGYDEFVTFWFSAQSVLTLIMLALIALMARPEKPRTPRRAMGGLGTVVLTVLALYLGAALTSGFVILSAAWITSSTPWISIDDVKSLVQPGSKIQIPSALQYAGLGTFVVAIVVLIVAVLAAGYVGWLWAAGGSARDRAHAAAAAQQARADQPERFGRHRPSTIARRRLAISRSIWLARRVDFLSDYLAVLVLSIGVIGSLVTLYFGYRLLIRGETTETFDDVTFASFLGLGPVNAVAVGVWLIGILVVALVVLGALAFRVPKTRKAVGILWDLGAFWPRDVHPLAPPCYAERAVPELAMRLAAHAAMVSGGGGGGGGGGGVGGGGGGGGGAPADGGGAPATGAAAPPPAGPAAAARTIGLVVLAGHSQGTVISMAALLGPARDSARHTVFLTFGTVLRRLYARFFPLYFSDSAFAAVARRLGEPDPDPGQDRSAGPWGSVAAGLVSTRLRWRNLWRRTDYLGGRVGDPLADTAPPATGSAGRVQIDVELVDPLFLPVRGDSTMPAAGRHSNFTRDPDFQAQLMLLVRSSFESLNSPSPYPQSPDAQPPDAQPPGAQPSDTQPSGAQPSDTQPPGETRSIPRETAPATRPDELMNPRESMV